MIFFHSQLAPNFNTYLLTRVKFAPTPLTFLLCSDTTPTTLRLAPKNLIFYFCSGFEILSTITRTS